MRAIIVAQACTEVPTTGARMHRRRPAQNGAKQTRARAPCSLRTKKVLKRGVCARFPPKPTAHDHKMGAHLLARRVLITNGQFQTMKGSIMKKINLSKPLLVLACLSALGVSAQAQTAPAAPESTLAFNAGVVSEYRYRGLSQTRFQPAVQGGVDYADKSGVYVEIGRAHV